MTTPDNLFYIQWHITDKCNLRCVHCYQTNFTSIGELDLTNLRKTIDNVLDTLKKWDKYLKITVTGGEPFLKNEFWDIINYLETQRRVTEISIITNGTIIDKYIQQLHSIKKLKEILVSLDGTVMDINDNIRNRGVYDKVVKNIKLLKKNNLYVCLMYTLMKRNLHNAKYIHEFALNIGIDAYIIERFIPLGVGTGIKNEIVSGQEIRELYEHIFLQSNIEFNEEEIARYRALRVELNNSGKIELFGAPCTAGYDAICVLPDGTVLPCRRFYLPIGNLLKQSLDEIWDKSDVLKNIRNRTKLKGRCNRCTISDCYGCRAIAYAVTGDYLSEDPQCFIKNR
jgi:radical SAM protein with 4Fe4S-binding SPASM domain